MVEQFLLYGLVNMSILELCETIKTRLWDKSNTFMAVISSE